MIKCDSDKADAEFNNPCKQLTTKISTYVSKEESIDFDPVFCSFAHFVTSDLVDSKKYPFTLRWIRFWYQKRTCEAIEMEIDRKVPKSEIT